MIGPNRNEVANEVVRVISETMAIPITAVRVDSRIGEDLNATSMDMLSIALALEDAFSTEIDFTQIPTQDVSVNWVVDFIFDAISTK